jgi:predicted carbohydrate-binding protein with CBM5 and CBM33 domain
VRKPRTRTLLGAALSLATVIATVVSASPASAHGAMQIPGSRTWLCYEDGITSTGQIIPQNPACQTAVATSGVTPLYNWFAVGNRAGATSGGLQGFIPDGKLCSGNSNYFDFSGFDHADANWPVTHLTGGATIEIDYNKWAAHPGTFSLYVTKPGWDQTKPLTWAEMNTTPFSSSTNPPSVGDPGSNSSHYFWNATLPALTGRQIILSVWARSDSSETFYGCSDVNFDGGNGNVTGIGAGAPPPPSQPCSAVYTISSSWPGGYQASVAVTNPNATAINSWTVSWTVPDGTTISSVWNGTLSQAGSLATVKSASWNGQLASKASTSFGLTANSTGTAAPPASITCNSP